MTDSKCRFCLEDIDPDDCGSSLFDKRLRLAMAGVFPFEIPFRRDLPMYTCKRCSWNVMDFHDYCEMVQKNQEKLKQEFCLDDEFETDEDLPMESIVCDDTKEEAAATDCEASYLFKTEYPADGDIHLSPVAITPAIMDDEDDDSGDDIKVAYEFHPDFESADCEETCESDAQLSVSNEEHKISSISEEKVKMLKDEESHKSEISVNPSVSPGAVHDPTFSDRRRSSRLASQSKSSVLLSNREREPKSVDTRSHDQLGKSPQKRAFCKQGVMRRSSIHSANFFQCDACEKAFSSTASLKVHVDVHHTANATDETKYVCDQCGKRFLCGKKLRDHKINHVRVACPVCKKAVAQKALTQHIAAHEGAFDCDVCDITYATKLGLQRHKDTKHKEGGAKKSCDQCGKSFLAKYQLSRHLLNHQMVKCPVCEKSMEKRKLLGHIAAHEGGYRCAMCDELCSTQQNLKNHRRFQHCTEPAVVKR